MCMCYTNWKHLNVWGHCVILYFRWLHFTFVRYGVPNPKGNFHLARKFCVVFNLHAMTRRDQSRPIAIERACNRCSLADYNFPAFHFYSIIGDCFFFLFLFIFAWLFLDRHFVLRAMLCLCNIFFIFALL